MKIRDLLWILAYPIYQVIGTFRHEGAHALAAILSGAEVTKFVFWPSKLDGLFYWGYVIVIGPTGVLFSAAPYLLDLITYIFIFPLCMLVVFKRKWIWINLAVIGLISPFANSLYNYRGRFSSLNDVNKILQVLPEGPVRGYFLITLGIYLIGIFLVFAFSNSARNFREHK